MCGRCTSTYYGETDRHLKVKSGEHIGISPLTFKKTKLSMESTICNHLLNCNNIPSFEEFIILTNGNNKFDLEIKDSLLGLVVKVLDSQSRGSMFKTTGWLQG